jgi:hypothetical protein
LNARLKTRGLRLGISSLLENCPYYPSLTLGVHSMRLSR